MSLFMIGQEDNSYFLAGRLRGNSIRFAGRVLAEVMGPVAAQKIVGMIAGISSHSVFPPVVAGGTPGCAGRVPTGTIPSGR